MCVRVKMQALDQKSTTEQKRKYFGDFSLGVILSVERYRYQAMMLNSLAMASYQTEMERKSYDFSLCFNLLMGLPTEDINSLT